MAAVFQNLIHQQHFDRTGWTHGPLLTPEDVEELKDGFAEVGRPTGDGMRAALQGENFGDRCDAYCRIRPIIERRLRSVLRGYRVCLAHWMVQSWGELHGDDCFQQDWSFVDERRMRSIHLWIPLCDVDETIVGRNEDHARDASLGGELRGDAATEASSAGYDACAVDVGPRDRPVVDPLRVGNQRALGGLDRKSTRLNSSHSSVSRMPSSA